MWRIATLQFSCFSLLSVLLHWKGIYLNGLNLLGVCVHEPHEDEAYMFNCVNLSVCNFKFLSPTHKIGYIVFIANIMFPYICSVLLYLYDIMLVNAHLKASEDERITFQGCKFHF